MCTPRCPTTNPPAPPPATRNRYPYSTPTGGTWRSKAMNQTIAIHQATGAEAGQVAATLADAFQLDPVSSWLFPNPNDRLTRHPHFFRIFIDVALADGHVHTTPHYEAVALWVDVDPDNPGTSRNLGDLF